MLLTWMILKAMEYYLRQIVVDNSKPVEIPLMGEIIIGRIIPDLIHFKQVSRRHANIHKDNGKWFIKDLGSINGVYLNQQKITKVEQLEIGDHIGFGVDNPSTGFVCAVSVRPLVKIKQEEVEVIDISDDDPISIKLEPPSDNQDEFSYVPYPGVSTSNAVNPVKSSILQVCDRNDKQKSISGEFSYTSKNPSLFAYLHSSNSKVIPGASTSIAVNQAVNPAKSSIFQEFVKTDDQKFESREVSFTSKNPSPIFNLPSSNSRVSPGASTSITVNPVKSSVLQKGITPDEQQLISRGEFSFASKNPSLIANLHNSNSSVSPYDKPKDFESKQSDTRQFSDNKMRSPNIPTPKDLAKMIEVKQPSCKLVPLFSSTPIPKNSQNVPLNSCNLILNSCGDTTSKVTLKDPMKIEKNTSTNVISSKLTTAIPSSSVLGNSPLQDKRSDQFKGVSKSTSSVHLSDKSLQEKNCHLVETSFGSLYSASSYLPQASQFKPQAKISTNPENNLLAVDKDCFVKLRRCDEEDEDSPGDLRFNAKRRRISSDSSDSENAPYSQVEEVITLDSDDDEYYDFNPSQVVVKTEPVDEELLEEVAVKSKEKVSYSNQAKELVNLNDGSNLPKPAAILSTFSHARLSDDDLSNNEPSSSETIENIKKYIENTHSGLNHDSDSSQSSHDEIIIPSKFKPKPPVKKSTGRILLTAPKPMERRPRYKRGREEWFEEKLDDSSTHPKQSGKTPKQKKSPKKQSAVCLKSFKIPKKTRSEGQKTPEKVRSSVLSAVEAPTDKGFLKKAGEDATKKKAPVIARKPGKPSRLEILASEPQFQPKRCLSKPLASPPKKSILLPARSFDSVSETLNKTVDNKMKQSYNNRSNTIEKNSNNNTSNRRIHFAENLQQPTESRISGNPRSIRTQIPSLSHRRPTNTYQPNNVDPKISRDPRINRATYSKSVGNLAPVYPAEDQFISNSMDIQQSNVPQTTNHLLSKYGLSASKPVKSSKAECGVLSSYDRSMMIKKIVKLNTKWLKEQNEKAEAQRRRGRSSKVKPPPDVMENASVIPLSFNSPDEYASAFTPLLMLEIWELMCDSWKEYQNTQKFYFEILSSIQKHGLREYICISIFNDSSFCPVRGYIVILNLRSEDASRHHKVQPVFGFVHEHQIEELTSNYKPTEAWKKCDPQWLQGGKVLRFRVYVKDRFQDSRDLTSVSSNILLKGSGLCNVTTKISLMDNFFHLSKSPLVRHILSPTDKGFLVSSEDVSPGSEYNHHQMVAINSVCKEMLTKDPKVMLIQGPPGTGKSHTLVGLLEKMVFSRDLNIKRVLVVAPSNAAIDEIGKRIIHLNTLSYRGILRFVRVGVPCQIAKALQPHTLDSMLKKNLDIVIKSKGEEIKKLREEIAKLQTQKSFESDGKIKRLELKISETTKLLSSQSENLYAEKKRILKESHVVLSTLGSCSQYIMTSTFRPDSCPFSCVIVDEAAQCTELEMLQTMAFRTNKLILIGDHQQLEATVISDHAKDFGLVRSMFERLHTCLTEKYRGSVSSLMLREQFRMHSEICKFPSRYFYHNKLTTSPSVILRDEKLFQNSFQKPYVVLDILESQEHHNLSSSKTNCIEASVVLNLCEQLLALKLSLSIGIITPYQGQCSLYTKVFNVNPEYYHHIEVNTVDGFQGQEKDVIILSCVRASKNGGIGFLACPKRLNVAITRARRILIICGCLNTLKQSPDWSALIEDARERKVIHSVTSEKDIPLLFQMYIRR